MASHLSSIGFPVLNEQDLYALAEKVSQKATSFAIDQGYYLSYQDPSGATIWLHADQQRQITGMNPHFAGPSIMELKIVRSLHKEKDHPFDGSYFAWARPEEEHNHQEGAYPFLFDAPDYLRHKQLDLPVTLKAQIAAFAHEIDIYATAELYEQAASDGPKMAAEAFIPAGLFPAEGRSNGAPPTAHALINGIVLDAQKRTNQLSGKPFWWIQLQSYGGIYDAVVDPFLLKHEPRPGCVAKGSFWLSGVILDQPGDEKPKAGFLRLLRNEQS